MLPMSPILRALRLFGRERGLWKYAIKPLLWGVAAYALAILMLAGASLGAGEYFGGNTGGLIALAVSLVLGIVFAGAIYLALVALIAGFGFDRLSAEVEERVYGHTVGRPLGFVEGLGDGVTRGTLTALCGVAALCLSPTVVGPWLVASFLCLLDFTAPSLLRRGVRLKGQFGVARRLPGALPFALIAGVIVLIPVVNVLALPVLVAAGTLLVADGSAAVRGGA